MVEGRATAEWQEVLLEVGGRRERAKVGSGEGLRGEGCREGVSVVGAVAMVGTVGQRAVGMKEVGAEATRVVV